MILQKIYGKNWKKIKKKSKKIQTESAKNVREKRGKKN